ncbi:MAG: sigma-70 family RNA polymerase sigma factor [Burkholderia sp.]|jgi:RNA polymerase sigma-70 factor (ECF subfamily)|uniref:sigma-70 family RNA polymerase sigma factor n=1 Tax=Burkholderia TaxID=32008 RepID=UPI001CA463D0|nr:MULTISPECIES: sigma-70 family RNA polymerase sigma factor [Burkholderia]MBY8606875.1 sigma-70 family RNA polymerase sigma factor [Burkholderia arboris]MCA3777437.1 sigma-70 family RNA polymerase sigma factor [Burkholderia sp.]MCA3784866.1 sigma-70 family RNA polymerase sigma factor [Burkholderia sp.]MCA3792380.1 sigma-70 family RNA polymerase sigma factor [Burkholderia sp.]MCA3803044.1 sigma-70 family RNA polymerase sigma factor [Burkholderia sp.]
MDETIGNAAPPNPADPAGDAGLARREQLNGLMSRTAVGDQTAFAELYKLSASRVYGVIVRMVRDRGEAEDLLQEVFTAVWRRADQYNPARGGAMTWILTLARNRTIDRIRQHREATLDEDAAPLDIPDDQPTPAALAEASEERARLEHCLQRLDAQHRSVVREAFFSGATYGELAERLRVPLGTMKSWIRRSLIQLRNCLEQ